MRTPKIITTEELAKLEFNEKNFNILKNQVNSLQTYINYKDTLAKPLTSTEDIKDLTKKSK
ncbi:MAG: hypothetical protein PHE56_05505 [Bacteroidales bacterium]|nr:hypothetical protein [Bacteroidales bacterium]